MNDPYKILGVDRNATPEDIKKAFKRKAAKYHPDREGGDEEKFKEAKAAYELIKDGPPAEPDWQPYDFDLRDKSRFEEFIKEAKSRQRQYQHVRFNVAIDLKTAVCGGRHYVRVQLGGAEEAIQVTIPAGTQDGETVKYPRLAKGFDMYITFTVLPDKEWTVKDLDLIKEVKISIWDLISGTQVNVKTIYDTTIKLKVPPKTQPGSMLRIKGKGIQSRKNILKVGDMYVHIQAFIPEDIHEDILSAIYRNNS